MERTPKRFIETSFLEDSLVVVSPLGLSRIETIENEKRSWGSLPFMCRKQADKAPRSQLRFLREKVPGPKSRTREQSQEQL